MKLQQKREREFAEREGSAKTTVIYGIWLVITLVIGFGLFYYLDDSGMFTMRALRSDLQLPSSVPEWVIMAGAIFVFALACQIALAFGFLIGSPEGRRKTGKADLRSQHKDLRDNY